MIMKNNKNDSKYHIESERIYLRDVRIDDVNNDYCRWLNDPETNKYIETRFYDQTNENIKQYVREMTGNENHVFFAICLQEDGRHVGNIKFSDIDWNHNRSFLSILIGEKDLWGKGYATEAIKLMARYGFETVGLNKIEACCYNVNKGAVRIFKKAGFSIEGELRDSAIFENKIISIILLGLTRKEWLYGQVKRQKTTISFSSQQTGNFLGSNWDKTL